MGGSTLLDEIFGDIDRTGMKLKVHDGMNGHLCYTCKRGQVINKKITYCGWDGGRQIHRKVEDCTWYLSTTTADVNKMEEIAWILKTDERTKKIGFRPLREVKNDPD